MTIPTPPVPLKDQCSIIYNDILYMYQVNAFQSLDLKDRGDWTKLSMGVPTNGSACVRGTVNGQDAFIVVGGSSSSQNYQGMQHYSFQTNKWQTNTPFTPVAMNRLGHGAVYLNQSSSVLMYAGYQDNSYAPSSQTFVVQTAPPYNIQAFESDAPPVMDPLMISWNTTHALMLGGGPTNTHLWTFGPQEGWQQLNVSLPSPLKDSTKVQATILEGSDGSKVLEIFDMSTSPNQLSTLLLRNATNTLSSSKKARSYSPSRHHPSKRRKRDVTLANRPAYNNTLAPQNTRVGFSLAQDPITGLVVAAGGDNQVPLAIFNQTGNQWVDPNQFFGNEPSSSSSPSATLPSHPSITSSPAATSSAAAAASGKAVKNKSLTILGGVLGGVFGVVILLILILLLLRYCRKRREKQRERQNSSYALDNKGEMDFADVGADYMKEAGGSFDGRSNHRRKASDKSDASVRVKPVDRSGAASSQSRRVLLHAKGDSAGSGKSFWSRGTKSPENNRSQPFISAPILGASPPLGQSFSRATGSPDARTEPRTDTGWSTYFANNTTQDFDPSRQSNDQDARSATYLSNSQSQSDYTASSTHPHASAEVEPLAFRASQNPSLFPPNAQVVSPTGFPRPGLGLALTHGASPTPDNGPPTPSTLVSDIDEEDEYARHSHSDGQYSWSPVGAGSERQSEATDPRVSSVYSAGYVHPGERVRIPNFPTVPSSQKLSANNSQVVQPSSTANEPDRGLRNIASKDFVRTPSGRMRDVPAAGTGRLPDYGASQVRTFPRRKEDLGARGRGSSQTEDMSWLNLGTSAERGNNHFPYGP
ncbi:hypothetical protein OEA41_007509 [Lepraria neglecta]|uniref:Pre-mRNA splicing factor CLF1 n=1 Tax=Lepraria neglecta TaxID=209136 RepID=A0AAE0DN00_9LECA|nr:hypothetical protein OEA41_007509 [Lepraria neglecta]